MAVASVVVGASVTLGDAVVVVVVVVVAVGVVVAVVAGAAVVVGVMGVVVGGAVLLFDEARRPCEKMDRIWKGLRAAMENKKAGRARASRAAGNDPRG